MLALAVVLGFGWPSTFSPLAHSSLLRTGIVVTVMALMGWTLQPKSIGRSIRNPLAAMLAIGVNIFVVPLLAWPSLWLLPTELAGGLIVASLVPCTLASAAVWTRSAGGDDAIAMMTTVVTNLTCFLVAPIGLWWLLGQRAQIDVDGQMRSLLWQVVLPLIAGQAARAIGFADFADRHKKGIANAAQVGILFMVMLGSVISAERLATQPPGMGGALVAAGALACVIHIAALAVGYLVAKSFGFARPQQIAITISGGQKTLMVGLQLALSCGVSVLPMVMYHVSQLFIDTLVVRWWNRKLPDA
jgi:solute carrier family 10 (sodium/bile acid cotransporter), member 7